MLGSKVDYLIVPGPRFSELRNSLKPYEQLLLDDLNVTDGERKLSSLKEKLLSQYS